MKQATSTGRLILDKVPLSNYGEISAIEHALKEVAANVHADTRTVLVKDTNDLVVEYVVDKVLQPSHHALLNLYDGFSLPPAKGSHQLCAAIPQWHLNSVTHASQNNEACG